jgi:ubiquitin fusion degradation protein 1
MAPPQARGPFAATYRCYPVAHAGKESLESGDKILLPATALQELAVRRVVYPMMFEASNPVTGQKSHCGVMEFSADEGMAYLPYWMMQNLCIETGGLLNIRNVVLPKGTFVKLQPHSTDFIELSDPRVILERALRGYSCLTVGDTIKISHLSHAYYLDVTEVRPGKAVLIIEADVNLEFDPPKDEAKRAKARASSGAAAAAPSVSTVSSDHKVSSTASSANGAASGAGAFNFGSVAADDTTTSGSSSSSKRKSVSSSTSSSDYFSKLGKGHSLTSSSKKSKKKKKKKSESKSSASNTLASASTSASTSASAPTASPLAAPVAKRITKHAGNFTYIYEVDPKTGKERLMRRLPRRNTGASTGSTANGNGASSSPFGGKGYSLK